MKLLSSTLVVCFFFGLIWDPRVPYEGDFRKFRAYRGSTRKYWKAVNWMIWKPGELEGFTVGD